MNGFLTGAFRVTCEDESVYTKFGRSICEQGVHGDEAISIYRNIAPGGIRAGEYQRITIHESMSNVQIHRGQLG